MAKLIDVDELKKAIINEGQRSRRYHIGDIWELNWCEINKVIDDTPTVEAIPIEWIKRYIAEEGIYPNRELLSVQEANAIKRMIENWEKENEIN